MEYALSSSRRSTNLPPSSPSRVSPYSHHYEDRNPPIPKSSSHDSPHRRVPRHAQHSTLSPPSTRSVVSKRSSSSHGSLYAASHGKIQGDDASSFDRLSVIASPSLPEADYFRRDSHRSQKNYDSPSGGSRRQKSSSNISHSATVALSPGRAPSSSARHHSSSRSSLRQSSLHSSHEEGDAATISSRRSETSWHQQNRTFDTPQSTKQKQNSNLGHWSADSTTSSGDGGSRRRSSRNSSSAQLALPILEVDLVQQHVYKTRRIVEGTMRFFSRIAAVSC
jgi:hypothetical protein